MTATQRITAPKVKGIIDDHITRHNEVYDVKLKRHDIALYGEKGDDGMVYDVREIVNGFKTIKGVGYAVLVTVAVDIATRFIK